MPSVGMRRSTRVFVPKTVVKASDGERVLRSGRRLWSESGKGTPGSASDGDEWFRLLDNNSSDAVDDDVRRCKGNNEWHDVVPPEQEPVDVMEIDGEMASPESVLAKNGMSGESTANDRDRVVYRKYGIVYHRKRRRLAVNRFVSEFKGSEDRLYGIPFVRKQRRKKPIGTTVVTEFTNGAGISGEGIKEFDRASEMDVWGLDFVRPRPILAFGIESSFSISSWRFNFVLHSILSYMMRVPSVRLSGLYAFMCTDPVLRVFSSQGIHLLQDLSCINNGGENRLSSYGICKIFGIRRFMPSFSVNFAAIPLCFRYMQSIMFLRYLFAPHALVIYLMGMNKKGQRTITRDNSPLSCTPTEVDLSTSKIMGSRKRNVENLVVRSARLAGRVASCRSNAKSRNFHRSSRRSPRVKYPPVTDLHVSNGAVDSDVSSATEDSSLFASPMSKKHKKSVRWGSTTVSKEMKSTLVDLRQNVDTLCCNANILVTEPDRCYRDEGAKILLECSSLKEWFLAITIEGSTRYTHKAQEVLRPCTPNRFTHAMIWTGENGWKLEFSDRRDWIIFKELHRECCDRNARNTRTVIAKVIPVPGVREVSSYEDIELVPFVRPAAYITMNGDEVSRAMMKKTANYDMDLEDEEWVNKINSEFNGENGRPPDHILAENFELMFDVLEKANYYNPDDVSDEKKAIDLCQNFGRSEIVAAVYDYWLKKRKQKRSALVRIFQIHPPRRAQLLQKPFLRKKRSFKRQASQSGRGKQRSLLQALAAEQNAKQSAIADENAMHAAEEAKRSADRSSEKAVNKRRRAQVLMEMADLATYKALMAMKIAEAAQITEEESLDAAAKYFLT